MARKTKSGERGRSSLKSVFALPKKI